MHFFEGNEETGKKIFVDGPVDAGAMLGELFASIDWPQLAGGVIVAVLLVYVASEYRRRALTS